MSWQRARNPEQKESRRSDIRKAAAVLFSERDFADVPLNDVAKAAGVSKAALYRYFSSKEEIFLDLLLADYVAWIGDLERNLAPLAGRNDPDAAAAALVATLEQHPRLAALSSIMASVLERNVEEETVIAFKMAATGFFLRAVNALHAAMPAIGTERLDQALRHFVALSNGLWPLAYPAPVVARVLEKPEFSAHRVDFYRALEDAMSLLLRGLLSQSA